MRRRSLGFWMALAAASAGAGVLYSALHEDQALWVGAVFGLAIGMPVLAFETGLLAPGLRRAVRAKATPVYVAATLGIFLLLILAGSTAAASGLWAAGILDRPYLEAVRPPRFSIAYSLLVSAVLAFALRVRDLIGAEMFGALLLGRYHRPVREERVFLFADLVGSTSFAARHGDVRAQEFLGEFFAALAEPVRRHRGSVDDYVGDMALISWPMARGVADAACIRCLFAMQDALDAGGPAWTARFGERPAFRAALHGGPVVTAEIGLEKHKIAYFGDCVNTTARLEALGKSLGAAFVVSADLLARLGPLPPGIAAADLGAHALRGRTGTIGCAALSRVGP